MRSETNLEHEPDVAELDELLGCVRARFLSATKGLEFAEYEREVIDVVSNIGRVLLARELARHDPVDHKLLIGGVPHTRVVSGMGKYMTVLGPVSVERGRYRSVRNGPTVVPLDLSVGVVEGFWTPKAAKVAALAVTDLTPARAERLFREMGAMTASKSSFDRLPKALGARWEADREDFEEQLRASETIPDEAVAVAVSIDGVMVAMNGGERADRKAASRARGQRDSGPVGHREATVGALSFYDATGARVATTRFARMPEKRQTTLREQVRSELAHVTAHRPDLTVVGVADGARGVWSFLGELEADVEVVDFYHASEHLKDALDKLMGATNSETHQRFLELRHELRHERGGVDTVISALEELESRRRRRAHLSRGSQYFRRHRERMAYAEVDARNLPVGSGVIEGTCKSVVTDRLRRAGMRWSEAGGGQAILTLRALSQSDRFDAAWGLLAGTYSMPVDNSARTAA